MNHWQNYTTDANTNSSDKPIPPSLSVQEYPINTTRPPKAWLYFNIFLTSLCVISFIYGITHTFATHQSLGQIPANIAATFFLPGIIVAPLLLILINETISTSVGAGIIGLFLSIPLGIMLIINVVLVLAQYRHHRYSESFTIKNLIFSIIPPLYVITVLTLFFINLN